MHLTAIPRSTTELRKLGFIMVFDGMMCDLLHYVRKTFALNLPFVFRRHPSVREASTIMICDELKCYRTNQPDHRIAHSS